MQHYKTTILCSIIFLIGLAVTSTVPPTLSHVTQPANHTSAVHYSTNQSTGVTHPANGNHSQISNHTGHGNETEEEEKHHAHGIHLVTVDFAHVKYPLVFGLVVILAALSKIGKYGKCSQILNTSGWLF